MTHPTKLLFIGLDSADPNLIVEWSEAGLLPNLRSLRERGVWGRSTSPRGLYSGSVWMSFQTALSPAGHGLYYPRQLKRGSYHLRTVKTWDVKPEPFWSTLGRAGRRVAMIDMPHAKLCANLNGIQLIDWAAHDPEYSTPCSWPASLVEEVIARFGRDPVGNSELPGRRETDYRELRDNMIQRIRQRTAISEHYLAQGGWDLFMTVFAAPHDIGHQCWSIHDPSFPTHDPSIARSLGDPIKDVYMAVDDAVGRLLEHVGKDTTVILLSSHGMGPLYTANHLLDEILQRLDRNLGTQRRSIIEPLTSAYRSLLPVGLRKHLRPMVGRLYKALSHADDLALAPARRQCKCFTLPHNNISGAIRVNVAGREPNGQIRPGAEYNDFCDCLTQDLLELRNLDNGEPVVDSVLRSVDLYRGEFLEDLPDLIIEWNRNAPIVAVGSPKIGEIKRAPLPGRDGDHRPEGLFFATGPGLSATALESPVRIEDFAPTITELLGVPLPGVDGEAIDAIVARNDPPSMTSPAQERAEAVLH